MGGGVCSGCGGGGVGGGVPGRLSGAAASACLQCMPLVLPRHDLAGAGARSSHSGRPERIPCSEKSNVRHTPCVGPGARHFSKMRPCPSPTRCRAPPHPSPRPHPSPPPRSSVPLHLTVSDALCWLTQRYKKQKDDLVFNEQVVCIGCMPALVCGCFEIGLLPCVCCCWLLVVGCWLLVVGCWLLVVGCWLLVVGCWMLDVGCWLRFAPQLALSSHPPPGTLPPPCVPGRAALGLRDVR